MLILDGCRSGSQQLFCICQIAARVLREEHPERAGCMALSGLLFVPATKKRQGL